MNTRNEQGVFGSWWGAGDECEGELTEDVGIDYRNNASELCDERWSGTSSGCAFSVARSDGVPRSGSQVPIMAEIYRHPRDTANVRQSECRHGEDLNDRGRGRTVETQGGGVSLLNALWQLQHVT